jgi:hypothetical protein
MFDFERNPHVARAVLGGGMIWIDAVSKRPLAPKSSGSRLRLKNSNDHRRLFRLANLLLAPLWSSVTALLGQALGKTKADT